MHREAALTDFEVARSEWETAFAAVPDEALGYLKPGDDYALGGLQVHVNWVLTHYHRILDAIITGGFAELPPQDPPGAEDRARDAAKRGLSVTERRKSIDDMAHLHEAVLSRVTQLPGSDWERKAAVVYRPGERPYPTSPEDIIGWLSDHYREHVQQSAELIEQWRSKHGKQS